MPTNVTGNGSVTRTSLVKALTEATSTMTKREASQIIESIIILMRDALAAGEEVKISGFGKFITRDKKARRGRNPKTGEAMTIAPRRVIKFRASEVFREELNRKLLG